MSRIPQDLPLRPDDLDVIDMDNHAIEEIAAGVIQAELDGELPRMTYSPCCPVMASEAKQAGERG